jgi:hypothetical protein
LTIEALPDALQWWDETRYWLIHKDSGLRVPGSFNETEALKSRKLVKVGIGLLTHAIVRLLVV